MQAMALGKSLNVSEFPLIHLENWDSDIYTELAHACFLQHNHYLHYDYALALIGVTLPVSSKRICPGVIFGRSTATMRFES